MQLVWELGRVVNDIILGWSEALLILDFDFHAIVWEMPKNRAVGVWGY